VKVNGTAVYYNIKSSRVVATADGKLHTVLNDKPILLKEFIEGEELRGKFKCLLDFEYLSFFPSHI